MELSIELSYCMCYYSFILSIYPITFSFDFHSSMKIILSIKLLNRRTLISRFIRIPQNAFTLICMEMCITDTQGDISSELHKLEVNPNEL